MPRIFIDGQEYAISDALGEATVGGLLTELVASLASSHKMICEVSLDGISLTEDSLRHAAQRDTASVQTVALKTMTYVELARFGLERAVLLVPEVMRQVEISAEHFRFKPQEEANRTYATCLDDLQLLVEVMDQLLKLQHGLVSNRYHAEQDALGNSLHNLAAVTGELLMAYRKDDVMVVADVLTYELLPLLEDIHQALQTLLRMGVH